MPGKSHGPRCLVGCSPWGSEELDTTERLSLHFTTKEEISTPLLLCPLLHPALFLLPSKHPLLTRAQTPLLWGSQSPPHPQPSPPAVTDTWLPRSQVRFGLSHSPPLEKAMTPHSSPLAWKIPRTEEPGRLWSMGSLRIGHE